MLKRLLALFARKKPTAQETFEEKLERLGGYQPTPLHHDHYADKIRRMAVESQSFPDQTRKVREEAAKPQRSTNDTRHVDRHGFSAPARRGMTINQASSSRLQTEDMIMAMMMRQTHVAPAPIRSYDDDDCRTTHHTPSHGGYDSPSDGGGGSSDGGGSSCD